MRSKNTRLAVLTVTALFGLLCLSAAAQAKQVQQYFYSGESFEVGTKPTAIAFDGADQTLLAIDSGKIRKYSPTGVPVQFSGLNGATSLNDGGRFIAVDESSAATAGNFYKAE